MRIRFGKICVFAKSVAVDEPREGDAAYITTLYCVEEPDVTPPHKIRRYAMSRALTSHASAEKFTPNKLTFDCHGDAG